MTTFKVYCAAERVGTYTDEHQAIAAAIEYSRETDRPVVIDRPNGRYQDTYQRRDGEWTLGPIMVERDVWLAEQALKQAAE